MSDERESQTPNRESWGLLLSGLAVGLMTADRVTEPARLALAAFAAVAGLSLTWRHGKRRTWWGAWVAAAALLTFLGWLLIRELHDRRP